MTEEGRQGVVHHYHPKWGYMQDKRYMFGSKDQTHVSDEVHFRNIGKMYDYMAEKTDETEMDMTGSANPGHSIVLTLICPVVTLKFYQKVIHPELSKLFRVPPYAEFIMTEEEPGGKTYQSHDADKFTIMLAISETVWDHYMNKTPIARMHEHFGRYGMRIAKLLTELAHARIRSMLINADFSPR